MDDRIRKNGVIGVIGGMGPYAGLDLVQKILDETKATTDQQHLPVALLSLPASITDRTEFILGRCPENPGLAIAQVATMLDALGCTVAGMPCNSAHAPAIIDIVTGELRQHGSSMQLLHLIEEAVATAQTMAPNPPRIGVLSTYAVHNTGLYRQQIEHAGMRCIMPSEEVAQQVHHSIFAPGYGIKAASNPVTQQARQLVLHAIRHLASRGANAVILGCTELPLATREASAQGVILVDATRALARALIRESFPEKLRDTDPHL